MIGLGDSVANTKKNGLRLREHQKRNKFGANSKLKTTKIIFILAGSIFGFAGLKMLVECCLQLISIKNDRWKMINFTQKQIFVRKN